MRAGAAARSIAISGTAIRLGGGYVFYVVPGVFSCDDPNLAPNGAWQQLSSDGELDVTPDGSGAASFNLTVANHTLSGGPNPVAGSVFIVEGSESAKACGVLRATAGHLLELGSPPASTDGGSDDDAFAVGSRRNMTGTLLLEQGLGGVTVTGTVARGAPGPNATTRLTFSDALASCAAVAEEMRAWDESSSSYQRRTTASLELDEHGRAHFEHGTSALELPGLSATASFGADLAACVPPLARRRFVFFSFSF